MRMRSAVTIALGALVLSAVLPGTASADTESFNYYIPGSPNSVVQIENPDGTTCYALDELAENESPVKLHNATATTAIVYESANCSGDSFELAPGEERAEEGMPAMSVAFADRQAAPADDQQAAPAEEAGPDQPMDEDEDAALEDEQAGPQRVAGDEHPHGIDRAAIVEDFLHAWG